MPLRQALWFFFIFLVSYFHLLHWFFTTIPSDWDLYNVFLCVCVCPFLSNVRQISQLANKCALYKLHDHILSLSISSLGFNVYQFKLWTSLQIVKGRYLVLCSPWESWSRSSKIQIFPGKDCVSKGILNQARSVVVWTSISGAEFLVWQGLKNILWEVSYIAYPNW